MKSGNLVNDFKAGDLLYGLQSVRSLVISVLKAQLKKSAAVTTELKDSTAAQSNPKDSQMRDEAEFLFGFVPIIEKDITPVIVDEYNNVLLNRLGDKPNQYDEKSQNYNNLIQWLDDKIVDTNEMQSPIKRSLLKAHLKAIKEVSYPKVSIANNNFSDKKHRSIGDRKIARSCKARLLDATVTKHFMLDRLDAELVFNETKASTGYKSFTGAELRFFLKHYEEAKAHTCFYVNNMSIDLFAWLAEQESAKPFLLAWATARRDKLKLSEAVFAKIQAACIPAAPLSNTDFKTHSPVATLRRVVAFHSPISPSSGGEEFSLPVSNNTAALGQVYSPVLASAAAAPGHVRSPVAVNHSSSAAAASGYVRSPVPVSHSSSAAGASGYVRSPVPVNHNSSAAAASGSTRSPVRVNHAPAFFALPSNLSKSARRQPPPKLLSFRQAAVSVVATLDQKDGMSDSSAIVKVNKKLF